MNVKKWPVLILAAVATMFAAEPSKEDTAAIKATALNYLEGWFSSDARRMEQALHPNLTKYIVEKVKDTEDEYLRGITADAMVAVTKNNAKWVEGKNYRTMDILYQDGRIAVIHAVSDGFYDIINLVKINGQWKIIQVLWDRLPDGQEK